MSLVSSLLTSQNASDSDSEKTPEAPTNNVKKKPKKTVTWRSDADLVAVRYFESEISSTKGRKKNARELDKDEGFRMGHRENENVEREAEEDEVVAWYVPAEIDFSKCERFSETQAFRNMYKRGGKTYAESPEAETQKKREESVLGAMYFAESDIPESASEPVDQDDSADGEPVEMKVPGKIRTEWEQLGNPQAANSTTAAESSEFLVNQLLNPVVLQTLLPFLNAEQQKSHKVTMFSNVFSPEASEDKNYEALAAMLKVARIVCR